MTRPKPGTLIVIVAAVVVLVISVVLDRRRSALAEARALPRFSGSDIVARMPSLLPSARLPARLRVAVVRDSAAASYYDSPATLDSIIEAWRTALGGIGADVRIVRSGSLHTERAAHVLVIPSAPCMTIETREAIAAAGARGQGLIVSGLAGAYDAGCRKIGYGLIVALTGASRVEMLEPRRMVYVVMPAGTPLSADIPPGARLEVSPARQLALRHPARDAYYADYAMQPQPAAAMPLLDGALVRGTHHGARVVYLGFELRDVFPRAWNRAIVGLLVRNAVAWTARLPLGWVEPWPHGRRAAAAITQDVEHQFLNARHALDSLRAAGVPGTYFVTSETAVHYKRLTRQLAEAGEVASHSENHLRLGGMPEDVQRKRLRRTQRQLHKLIGDPVAGLRPPEEQFDSATMVGWLAAGGSYLFGVNDRRVAAPELLRIGNDTLVLFSRVVPDDVEMAGGGSLPDVHILSTQFLNDLAQMRALGGIYLLSYHSQLLAQPEFVPAVAHVARAAAADTNTWTTTTGAIARWWRGRSALRVQTAVSGANALAVTVHNRGGDTISGAVARIALPDGRRVLGANTTMLASDAGMIRLALPAIAGATSKSFTVRLESRKQPSGSSRARATPQRRPAPRKAPWWQFWKHL